MTLADFWLNCSAMRTINPEWRLGQTAFNVLYAMRPDLSEQIRATPLDPFHARDPKDPRYIAFITYLEDNWDAPRDYAMDPRD